MRKRVCACVSKLEGKVTSREKDDFLAQTKYHAKKAKRTYSWLVHRRIACLRTARLENTESLDWA